MSHSDFSIVIPTYNRAELVRRAVDSALLQGDLLAEVVIVDDGSNDRNREALERIAGQSPRVRILHQSRGGAAAARNCGAAAATGKSLVFLDSDDDLLPGSLQRFAVALGQESVAVACAAAIQVDAAGAVVKTIKPRDLGPAYENQRGLFLAGSFALREEVFRAIGGFATHCRSSQHTELALRLVRYLKEHGLQIVALEEPTVRVHTDADVHLRGSLENLLAGAMYIINTHRWQLEKSGKHFSDWCTIAAVYAAKLERFYVARRLLWQAVKSRPGKATNYVRLGLTYVPPLARRVWRAETIK